MPNIQQYTNPIEGLQPTDRGVAAMTSAAAVGDRLARYTEQSYRQLGSEIGSAIGQVGDEWQTHVAKQEVAKGAADMATLQDNLTTSWNDLAKSADPNDHTLRQRFNETLVEPALQHYVEGFDTPQGKQWAQTQVDHLRQHMFEKTAADEATRAGDAMVQNLNVLKNRASGIVSKDPTSLNMTLGLVDRSIDAITSADPNLSPDAASKAKTELTQQIKTEVAHTAAATMIEQNPEAGKAALASGQFDDYLDGSQKKALDSYANTVTEAKVRDQRQAVELQKQQDKAQADQAQKQIYTAGLQSDGTWAPPAGFAQGLLKLGQMPGANVSELREWGSMAKTFQEDQASGRLVQSNPVVYDNFVNRMMIPAGQPGSLSKSEIYQAAALRSLSNHDAQVLTDGLDRGNDPAEHHLQTTLNSFITSQKEAILGSGISTAARHEKFYEFQTAMQQAVGLARQEGLTPQQTEEKLLDPTSKFYLGGPSLHMGYYTGNATKYGLHTQAVQAQAAQGAPAQPKWDGKEDLDVYLKRIGK